MDIVKQIQKAKQKYYGQHNAMPAVLKLNNKTYNEIVTNVAGKVNLRITNTKQMYYGGMRVHLDNNIQSFELTGKIGLFDETAD